MWPDKEREREREREARPTEVSRREGARISQRSMIELYNMLIAAYDNNKRKLLNKVVCFLVSCFSILLCEHVVGFGGVVVAGTSYRALCSGEQRERETYAVGVNYKLLLSHFRSNTDNVLIGNQRVVRPQNSAIISSNSERNEHEWGQV